MDSRLLLLLGITKERAVQWDLGSTLEKKFGMQLGVELDMIGYYARYSEEES